MNEDLQALSEDDPYAGINFGSAPIPSVNADQITETLRSLNGVGMPLVAAKPNAGADTKGGIDRVNSDTGNTGVVAYKDAKGQTVLTNVARDANSGKDTRILPSTGTTGGGNGGTLPDVVRIDTPLALTSILSKLATVTDSNEARGIFASFQEAAAKEQMRLQSESLAAAQTKLGIPSLEAKLAQSEATDKQSIGWYPGIGDSPVTQGMRTELSVARGYADTESSRNLQNNLSYKLLSNSIDQAKAEMTRVQKLTDRKDLLLENSTIREMDRNANRQAVDQDAAQALTNTELSRIQLLNSTDFSDVADPRVRAFKVLKASKNKDFNDAVTAQGVELPIMAIKGNQFAKQIMVAEESKNTGLPTAQVTSQIDDLRKYIDNPPTKELKDAFAKLATQGALASTDKKEIENQKIRTVLDWAAKRKTGVFLGDVSSWNSADPALLAAADSAAKTTGKRTMEDTLVAYLGDSTGSEYLQKLSEFNGMAMTAVKKQANSMLGMPDPSAVKATIANFAVEKGLIRKWIQGQMAQPLTATTGAMNFGLPGAAIGAWWEAGNNLERDFPITKSLLGNNVSAIDPATGKPFGAP